MAATAKSALRSFPLVHPGAPADLGTGAGRIIDLTARPRRGLRGRGTRYWCAAYGLPFPKAINTFACGNSCVVARLGQHEILVLAEEEGGLPEAGLPADVHDGYREEGWFWFRIQGPDSRRALGSLTSVDLRPNKAPAGTVLQTRLAGLDAVLVIRDENDGAKIDVFGDIASSDYMMDVFSDRFPDWPDPIRWSGFSFNA